MKKSPLILVAVMVASFAQLGFAQSSQEILTEAQQAYLRGDTDTAKQKFQLVLELNPRNITAQNYLHMIEMKQNSGNGNGAEMEKKLSKLVLSHVEVKDASFQTTLDYLKQLAEKQKQTVSFVVQVPPEVADMKKVTLNLSNVPFTEVLHYVGELTGLKFSIEKYAIVVKQPQAEAPATAAASPAPMP